MSKALNTIVGIALNAVIATPVLADDSSLDRKLPTFDMSHFLGAKQIALPEQPANVNYWSLITAKRYDRNRDGVMDAVVAQFSCGISWQNFDYGVYDDFDSTVLFKTEPNGPIFTLEDATEQDLYAAAPECGTRLASYR